MENNGMKARLLATLDLLKKKTDHEHRLSTNQIIALLEEQGFKVERKTLYDDMMLIKNAGYPLKVWKRRANEYYMEGRDFDSAELMIMIDAVKAARFISPRITDDFVRRLELQAGPRMADILETNPAHVAVFKHANEEVYQSLERIGKAIVSRRKITFAYFDLDENKKRKYRRRAYLVNPIETVICEENLYLLCYDDKHANIGHYRVDRMTNVRITEEEVKDDPRLSPRPDEPILFGMFTGTPRKVTLEFTRDLMGIIYDTFGESSSLSLLPSGKYSVTINVQVSPVFLGWCAHFPEKLWIKGPDDVVAKMRSLVKRLALQYEVADE